MQKKWCRLGPFIAAHHASNATAICVPNLISLQSIGWSSLLLLATVLLIEHAYFNRDAAF
jgi:hypothetical protein